MVWYNAVSNFVRDRLRELLYLKTNSPTEKRTRALVRGRNRCFFRRFRFGGSRARGGVLRPRLRVFPRARLERERLHRFCGGCLAQPRIRAKLLDELLHRRRLFRAQKSLRAVRVAKGRSTFSRLFNRRRDGFAFRRVSRLQRELRLFQRVAQRHALRAKLVLRARASPRRSPPPPPRGARAPPRELGASPPLRRQPKRPRAPAQPSRPASAPPPPPSPRAGDAPRSPSWRAQSPRPPRRPPGSARAPPRRRAPRRRRGRHPSPRIAPQTRRALFLVKLTPPRTRAPSPQTSRN